MMNEPILPWFGNTSGTGTMPWPGRFDLLVDPGTDTFVNRQGHPNAFYNFAPTNYFMRPDERITLGVFGHHAIGDRAEVYVELNYMDDETVSQLAPSGSFFELDSVSCGHPLLSQQQFDLICSPYNLTAADSQTVFIGRRNVEGGSRTSSIQHTSYRAVAGIRGDFGNSWSYDAYLNYGEVQYDSVFDEDLSIDRMLRSIDAVAHPVTGEAVCASVLDGSDPDCVPWNVFESGAVTQEMLDYITLPIYFEGDTEQIQFNAFVSSDLGDYGIRVPTADDSVQVVMGVEYRDESLDYRPDETAQMGGAAGFGEQIAPVSGGYSVAEFFGEAVVPVLQGKKAAELVSVDLAYRYSDYSTDKQTNTYKVAAEWTVVPSVRLRASFQRAVRVGNIHELFEPQRGGGGFASDSCEGTNPVATFEECQLTGVTSAQYGNIPENTTNFDSISTIFGGNPNLDPEESDTVSYGFIFMPEFLPGLTLSVDYFDVEVTDAIAEPDSQFVFDSCIDSGAARFCDSVNRDPATGLLWLGEGHIVVTNTNIGFIKTSGYDIVGSYEQPIGRFGDMSFDVVSTYLDTWDWQELPGEDPWNCVGVYWNGPCERPRPEWRSNLRTTWITPWDASISLLWRYASEIEDYSGLGNDIPSTDYLDLAGLWEVRDDIVLRVGINNVLDADPPIASFGSGNSWPEMYDALGRYWFAGLTMQL
jgi:outer membrane receptor protein involved in Fe transport